MLIVLSPAKTLDFDTAVPTAEHTKPDFVRRSSELVDILKEQSPAQLGSLMDISDQLAVLNASRYASWTPRFTSSNSRQAVFAFNGDVYEGLDAYSLSERQVTWLQAHVRILSGLYGVLRPLDRMQPYRLEMGTRLANAQGKDLYAFWGDEVTLALNEVLSQSKSRVLVNLASEEYFKVVRTRLLDVPVITPVFEERKGNGYKIVSFHAKRARGLMARYAAQKALKDAEKLKGFDVEGYRFDESVSGPQRWVFRRESASAA